MLATLALASLLIACPQESPASEAAFTTELQKLLTSNRGTRWESVEKDLLRLLREHEGERYVRMHLPDIRQRLRDAAFWSAHERPDENEIVSGELKTYDRFGGKFKLVYDNSSLLDFELKETDAPEWALYLHPMQMAGRYTIEIEAYPEAMPMVLVGVDGGNCYRVTLGENKEGSIFLRPHVLTRFQKRDAKIVDSTEPKERKKSKELRTDRLEISVSEKDVQVKLNGRRILKGKNESGELGQFGFVSFAGGRPTFESLEIRGIGQTSWIEGLIEKSLQSERQAFERAYREPEVLAAWSAAEPSSKGVRRLEDLTKVFHFTDHNFKGDPDRMRELAALLTAHEFQQLEEQLNASTEEELPTAPRELFRASLAVSRSSYLDAVAHLDVVLRENDSKSIQVLRAALLPRIEDFEGAIRAYRGFLAAEPEELTYHYELSRSLLMSGRLDEARESIEAGLLLGPTDRHLLELRDQIVKAQLGPSWQKTFEVESERFRIASESSQSLCRIARSELERTVDHLQETFGTLPETGTVLPVYLFASEAGYGRYAEGISSHTPSNTVGLYSPALRQILAWNSASRDELLHTLRHEATHHYLHRRLGATPLWFTEGYAEWIAHARTPSSHWKPAKTSEHWVEVFDHYGGKLIPLEDLFFREDEMFEKNTALAYAQSWALVTMLEETQDGFLERLWKELEGQIDPGNAQQRALMKGTLRRVQSAMRKYVRELRRAN